MMLIVGVEHLESSPEAKDSDNALFGCQCTGSRGVGESRLQNPLPSLCCYTWKGVFMST